MQQVGRYELVELIGQGGMGAVYRARDPLAERFVAVKLLTGLDRPVRRKRFQREAELLAKVVHRHVVRLFDVAATPGGQPYLVMELIRGESLRDRLDREGPYEVGEALALASALCAAVQACHDAGVLHRDLKPGNALVGEDGVLKLVDFGLVRDTDPSTTRTALSAQGSLLGSPEFLAPEQARGDLEALGPATDVYGLGGTLYALLTGAPPHGGDSLVAMLESALGPKRPPSALNPAVPAWLDDVVLRALDPDPAARWPSAASLAAALADPAADPRPGASRAASAAGLGLVVVGLAAAGLVLVVRGDPPEPAPTASASDPAPVAPVTDPAPVPDTAPTVDPAPAAPVSDPAHAGLAAIHEQAETRGKRLFNAGRLEAAVAAFSEALAVGPCVISSFHRGQALAQLGRVQEAIADYRAALEAPASSADGLLLHGQAHLQLRRWRDALAVFAKARALDSVTSSADTLAQLDIAEGLARLGLELGDPSAPLHFERDEARQPLFTEATRCYHTDPARALELLGRLIAADRHDVTALHNRAAILAGRGDFAGALADVERVIGCKPTWSPGHALHADVLRGLRRYDEALTACDRALLAEPDLPKALRLRAALRELQARDLEGALADYDRLLAGPASQPHDHVLRGRVRQRLRDFEGAVIDYERALELEPDASWADQVRAVLAQFDARSGEPATPPVDIEGLRREASDAQARGEPEAALRCWDRVIELDPGHGADHAARGRLRHEQEDFPGAVQDFERALALEPDAPWVGAVRRALGRLADRFQRHVAAPSALGEAPTPAQLRHRGMARLSAGDFVGALEDFERGLAAAPHDPVLHLFRGRVALLRGQFASALADVTRAIELADAKAGYYNARAGVHLEAGDPARAAADYERALELEPTARWAGAIRAKLEAARHAAGE